MQQKPAKKNMLLVNAVEKSISWKYKEKVRDPKRKVKMGLWEITTGERKRYGEEEWLCCLQNRQPVIYGWVPSLCTMVQKEVCVSV